MASMNNWFSAIFMLLVLYSVIILFTQPSSIRLPRLDRISHFYDGLHPNVRQLTAAHNSTESETKNNPRKRDVHDRLDHPTTHIKKQQKKAKQRDLSFGSSRDAGSQKVEAGDWVRLEKLPFRAFLLSAFWDARWKKEEKPCVSLLAVIQKLHGEKPRKLHCILECGDINGGGQKTESAPVDWNHFRTNTFPMLIGNSQLNGTKYNRHVIKCIVNKCTKPTRVTLVTGNIISNLNNKNSVPVEYPITPAKPHQFGVCVPLAFGKVDPVRLVEWVEMMQIIGVSRIVVYNDSLSDLGSQVLRFYEDKGLVEIRQNTKLITSERNDIRMRNTMILTDCLYRNMYNFINVVIIDFDEAIIPTEEKTLGQMMRKKLKSKEGPFYQFKFDNVYFILEEKYDKKATDSTMPKFSVFLRKRRKLPPSGKDMHVKSILNPLGCALVFNHYCAIPIHKYKVAAPEHSSFYAGHDVGRNLHYRENACRRVKSGGFQCKDKVKSTFSDDDIMLRYRKQLVTNMKKILKKQTWYNGKDLL